MIKKLKDLQDLPLTDWFVSVIEEDSWIYHAVKMQVLGNNLLIFYDRYINDDGVEKIIDGEDHAFYYNPKTVSVSFSVDECEEDLETYKNQLSENDKETTEKMLVCFKTFMKEVGGSIWRLDDSFFDRIKDFEGYSGLMSLAETLRNQSSDYDKYRIARGILQTGKIKVSDMDIIPLSSVTAVSKDSRSITIYAGSMQTVIDENCNESLYSVIKDIF